MRVPRSGALFLVAGHRGSVKTCVVHAIEITERPILTLVSLELSDESQDPDPLLPARGEPWLRPHPLARPELRLHSDGPGQNPDVALGQPGSPEGHRRDG